MIRGSPCEFIVNCVQLLVPCCLWVILFALGFTDFRVRLLGGFARVQVPADQMARLVEQREEIIRQLGPLYRGVLLDLEERHG